MRPGSRSNPPRPDTIEVRDECSDLLWRRRDNPLMTVSDLHRPLTSPFVHRYHCHEHSRFAFLDPGVLSA
jgi:hypothetical protein